MKTYVIFAFSIVFLFSGCKSQSILKGTAGGAAIGAAIGATSGKLFGNTALGTISGAIIGGSISAIRSAHAKNEVKQDTVMVQK